MRDFLTYIGVALIALLSAIFAAPYIVDFNAFRPNIAAELSRLTGARARLDGRIALHFLPTPRFSAEDIDLSGDFGRIHAKSAVFTLAAPALLKGKLQFIRAALDDADVALEADKPAAPALAADMQFDDFELRRAAVTILRDGVAAVRIAGLDLDARIPGPQGPFDGRGSFDWRGRRLAFAVNSDLRTKNLLPLKASLTWPEELGRTELGRIDFDGRLDFSRSAFDGDAKAEGKAAPGQWSAQASMQASLDGAQARDFSARLGDGPLADRLSGALAYESGAGKIAVALESPHLSQDWAEFFAAPLAFAAKGGAPFDLSLSAAELAWRGASWSGARLSWKSGAPAEFRAMGPGETRVEVSAAPNNGVWRGKARLNTKDFGAFAAAMGPDAAGAGVQAPPQTVEASGDFTASPLQWELTRGDFLFGRNRFSGALWGRPPTAGKPPQLTANLSSEALDLDSAPDFALAGFGGFDLDLSLHARTLKSARAGVLSDEGGRIDAHLLRRGDAVRLDRLDMTHIGGADLFAAGAWRANFSGLRGEARLKAGDLRPLAKALARLWPDALTRALAARAKILSPADLAGRAEDGGFVVDGTLGKTRIAATFPPAGAARAVTVDLSAPEAGTLLGQFGAPVVWTQQLGAARLSARAEPDPARQGARKLAASVDLAGLHGEFRGGLGEDFGLDGEAKLSGDAGAVLALYSVGSGPAPLRLSARAAWRDGALSFSDLSGDWQGVPVAGDVAADSAGLKGTLRCGRFSGAALVALVLGPPSPAKAGALWSSLSFAPVLIDPPPARFSVTTDDLEPFGGKARFDVALGPGALSVSQGQVALLGGVARGGFDLRRDGRQVSVSGEVEAGDLALDNPAFSARLDGGLKFAGGGVSAAALAASLAGEGAVRLRDLAIAQAAPDAADAALKASEGNEAPFDAKAVANNLDAAFAQAPLRRAEAGFAARLADGHLALTPADEGGQGIDAGVDLRDATLSLVFSAAAHDLPAGWTAAAPGGSAAWSGPWRAPARKVDAAAFVDAVATRALERENARIEQQKREDQERLRALSAQPEAH